MRNNLDKTLDDVDIPRDENWEFEYETATQSH